MENRRLTGRNLHYYFNPERRNSRTPSRSTAYRRIPRRQAAVARSPTIRRVPFSGAEIVIHNAGFDVGFLNEELRRAGKPLFSTHVGGVTDTLVMARDQFPGKSNSLDALCKRLEVDNTNDAARPRCSMRASSRGLHPLTRGQDSLVMVLTEERAGSTGDAGPIDPARSSSP